MRKSFAGSQFRWSIATILTLSMVLIIALVMALTTLLDVRRERAIFRDQLEEKGLHLFSMLESAAAEPDFPNQHELNDITAMMMSQPDLSYFRILTPDGLVLASSEGGKPTLSNQATPQALKTLGQKQQKEAETLQKSAALLKGALGEIAKSPIDIPAKANEKGVLFKKINAKDIADAISTAGFSAITEDDIILKEPIKEVGEYKVYIKRGEAEATVKITVTPL